jgi:GxxExxY protein
MLKRPDDETYCIIGIAMDVHRHLGPGFLEAVYHAALAREFASAGVPHVAQAEIPVYYRGESLGLRYRADFVCFGSIVIELKVLRQLGRVEEAQIIHYLKAGRFERGLLLNFGCASLQVRRFVGSQSVQSV